MKKDFAGKVVLITGAGSGIGRETAFSFAEAGASLELVDIDESGLERTTLHCRKLGASVHSHKVDVSSALAMEALALTVHKRWAALDVLINNAGVGVAGSLVGTELSVWDWAISINVKGVIHGCHYFVPNMVAQKRGHVVNVASAAGLVASKMLPVYSTTKFAVVGFSESLRAELHEHGIGVTTLCQGLIDTPITRSTRLSGNLADSKGFHERTAKLYKRRNYGPDRVARAVLQGVRKKRGLLPVTPESWLMYYGKRFAPGIVEALLARDLPL
jgi:NADP-dependent 3-hydroxy acid dehydrogenase YdfG